MQEFFESDMDGIYQYMMEFYPSYTLSFQGFLKVYTIDDILREAYQAYKDHRYNRIG